MSSDIPASYGDTVICSNSIWKLSYAIASIYPIGGRCPGWRLSRYPSYFLSSLDPRLRSLQLIAVRPNGSSIRLNTVAIISRPRSPLAKRESKKKCLSLCVWVHLLFFLLTMEVVWFSFSRAFILIRYYLALLSLFSFFFITFLGYIDLVLSASFSFLFSICCALEFYFSFILFILLLTLFSFRNISFHFYASFGLPFCSKRSIREEGWSFALGERRNR